MPTGKISTPEDFWARVEIGQPDECWDWQGPSMRGYGQLTFRYMRKMGVRAHRVAYALAKNNHVYPLAEEHIHHTCMNRLCCNPDHLFAIAPGEHTLLHRGPACGKHRFENWNAKTMKCRICDRERHRRKREEDPSYREIENARRRDWYRRMKEAKA